MTRISTSMFRTGLALATAALLLATGTTSFGQSSTKTNKTSRITAPVDVNSADLETLQTLPGVGPSVAKKIVDGRPYKSLADLEKVKGLGKTRADALKDLVTFGSAPASTASAPAASSSSSTPPTDSSSGKSTGSTSKSTKSTPSAGRLAAGEKVNINTATAEELDKIPGIGPAKAQAIVDYRTQNGKFKTIEDIQKVKGIKEGVFSKIKDYLKVE